MQIAQHIVSQTIGSYLKEQKDLLFALKNLKILDPACGDGVFLLACFDFLLEQYQTHFPDFQHPKSFIVAHNLYGVDLELQAVNLCKERLFEKSNYLSPPTSNKGTHS